MSRYNDIDKPSDEERIKVRRVIEYEGPRSWVEETIKRAIKGEYVIGVPGTPKGERDLIIREISVEELSNETPIILLRSNHAGSN